MKRYGNLYYRIVDIDNIKLAHRNASKGKQKYKEVIVVNKNVEYYCKLIQDILINKTYVVSNYRVKEKIDKGKIRTLYILPYFPDRIIQHAIMQVLEPIWKKVLINDTFQSIKGRGVHKAKERVENAIKVYKPTHVLKTDVKKFYPSIKNSTLQAVVRKKIKCNDTLWLLDKIICSLPELPIGNYISQYLGNLTLAYLDHHIKSKYNVKMYFRYCDDIVVLGEKERLRRVLSEISARLIELELELKNTYQIGVISDRGVNFVGFIFRIGSTKLRKSIAKRMIKSRDTITISSYFGWAKAARAKGLWYKHIKINKEFKW